MSNRDEELLARIAWSLITVPGDRTAAMLIDTLGATEALEQLESVDEQITKRVINANYVPLAEKWLSRYNEQWLQQQAQRELEAASQLGITPLIPGDEAWPTRLKDIESSDLLVLAQPPVLWVRGDPSLLNSTCLAITGTRASTGYGEHVTAEIANHTVQHGVTVLATASQGIDNVANRTALTAGGNTIAVVAGGIDRHYPVEQRELIDSIADNGCVISGSILGTVPNRLRFDLRNRVIAVLADAVVIPEASDHSGVISVAQLAHDLVRPVGAVPGPVTSATSAGCHRLIQQNTAKLITNGADALAMLGR